MGLMSSDGLEVDLFMHKFLVQKSILSGHFRDRKSKLLKLFLASGRSRDFITLHPAVRPPGCNEPPTSGSPRLIQVVQSYIFVQYGATRQGMSQPISTICSKRESIRHALQLIVQLCKILVVWCRSIYSSNFNLHGDLAFNRVVYSPLTGFKGSSRLSKNNKNSGLISKTHN